MGSQHGKSAWELGMGTWCGKSAWEVSMGTWCGNWHGNLVWEQSMGTWCGNMILDYGMERTSNYSMYDTRKGDAQVNTILCK